MNVLVPTLGVAYAAVLVWLTVRIVNQPKHWDMWKSLAVFILVSPLIGVVCLFPTGSRSAGPAAQRTECKNNLNRIGLALHNYRDTWGSFPPAYVADANGRPMYSWRVLILPWLDEIPLYNKYRFDEPWDGPNNRFLADKIVAAYNCMSDDHGGTSKASTMTNYVAIVGPETAWPGAGTVSIDDMLDGTSNTLMVVEVVNSGIHWMEPRDLHVGQMAPTINAKSGQGISSRHPGGACVLLGDSSVRFFPESLSAAEIRAWLTIDAGDKNNDF